MRSLITASVVVLAAAFLAFIVASSGAAPKKTVSIYGTVGPGFAITLKTAKGVTIKRLAAGTTYVLVVRDRSDIHNFHLVGPGINRKTTVDQTGTFRWTITPRAGTYTYKCDPHAPEMQGTFRAA